MLTSHRPTRPLIGFAVGSIEYCLCKFRQLRNFLLTIHEYTHLPSPDTVSDTVFRWLDRVVPIELWAVSILLINNPQICSLAVADNVSGRVCRRLDLVFSLQLQTFGLLPFNNPQIYSIAFVRHGL